MHQIAGICIVEDMVGVPFLGLDPKLRGFSLVSGGEQDIDAIWARVWMVGVMVRHRREAKAIGVERNFKPHGSRRNNLLRIEEFTRTNIAAIEGTNRKQSRSLYYSSSTRAFSKSVYVVCPPITPMTVRHEMPSTDVGGEHTE